MHKDQREELQRLEEALLEPEIPAQKEDADQWLDELYEQPPVQCDVYNTDNTDVDLDDFSEQVHQGRRGCGCLVPIIILLTALLCALIGWVLWKQGVIPWA